MHFISVFNDTNRQYKLLTNNVPKKVSNHLISVGDILDVFQIFLEIRYMFQREIPDRFFRTLALFSLSLKNRRSRTRQQNLNYVQICFDIIKYLKNIFLGNRMFVVSSFADIKQDYNRRQLGHSS